MELKEPIDFGYPLFHFYSHLLFVLYLSNIVKKQFIKKQNKQKLEEKLTWKFIKNLDLKQRTFLPKKPEGHPCKIYTDTRIE